MLAFSERMSQVASTVDRKEHERRVLPVALSFRTDIPHSQYNSKGVDITIEDTSQTTPQ